MCSCQFADVAKFAELKQSFQKRECREPRASCSAGNACTSSARFPRRWGGSAQRARQLSPHGAGRGMRRSRQRWHCAGGTSANGAALCAPTGAGCAGAAEQQEGRARLTFLGLLSVRACACCSGGHHLHHHRDYHLPRNHLHGSAPHPSACLSKRAQRHCTPPPPSHLQHPGASRAHGCNCRRNSG